VGDLRDLRADERLVAEAGERRRAAAHGRPFVVRGYTRTKPVRASVGAVSYAFVEDVAASWEQYERFAAALAGPTPEGLLVHAAGPTDEGFRIIAVWESEDAWRRFLADRLGDAFETAAVVPPVFRALRPAHVVLGERKEGR
jgi:hypothetical protein